MRSQVRDEVNLIESYGVWLAIACLVTYLLLSSVVWLHSSGVRVDIEGMQVLYTGKLKLKVQSGFRGILPHLLSECHQVIARAPQSEDHRVFHGFAQAERMEYYPRPDAVLNIAMVN